MMAAEGPPDGSAQIESSTTNSTTESLPSLPVVPLYWSEFVWSLEKLRHRPYSSKRDWYRINPLEIVLLGCKSLADRAPASTNQITFIMTMEDLNDRMSRLPRYWLRLYFVLYQTIMGKDTPNSVIERCTAGLVQIIQAVTHHEQLYAGFMTNCMNHDKGLQNLIKYTEPLVSPNTKKNLMSLNHLRIHKKSIEIYTNISTLHTTASTTDINNDINIFTQILIKAQQLYSQATPTESSSASQPTPTQGKFILSITFLASLDLAPSVRFPINCVESILSLVEYFFTYNPLSSPSSLYTYYDYCLIHLFQILQLLISRKEHLNPNVSVLMLNLRDFLIHWQKHVKEFKLVIPALLELVLILLHTNSPIEESVEKTINFLQNYLILLMKYSHEGYLSDTPMEFFVCLLNFISSLVESGAQPTDTINEILPNIFSLFFGIRNHTVSCLLLEYCNLSMSSQHKDKLLNEGLKHIVKVWRLFPSIDRKIIEEKSRSHRLESLTVCSSIIEELVNKVFIESSKGSHDQGEVSHDQLLESHDQPQESHAQPQESHGQTQESPDQPQESHDQTQESYDQPQESHDQTQESHDQSQESHDLTKLTEMDRANDKAKRLTLMFRLLELACAIVRNGDDITFMFASVLPQLFSPNSSLPKENIEKLRKIFGEEPPPRETTIKWNVDKKDLAINLLSLSILSLSSDTCTPFELCGIVMPKLARSLDTTSYNDQEKMIIANDILLITKEALKSGSDISEFMSHGLELVTFLLPRSSSLDEIRELIKTILQHLIKAAGPGSLLFLIRNSCYYLRTHFPQEIDATQLFIRMLISKGRRNDIRAVFRICRDPLDDEFYTTLRTHLFNCTSGSGQLQFLCEIILKTMDLTKISEKRGEEESKEEIERKKKELQSSCQVIKKMIWPLYCQIDETFSNKKFNKSFSEQMTFELSNVALFRTLFFEDLSSLLEYSVKDLVSVYTSKFPTEVHDNHDMMKLLSLLADRMEHFQERYVSLKSLLTSLIKRYLSATDFKSDTIKSDLLSSRERFLNSLISSLPRNENDLKNLIIKCNYSPHFWDTPFTMTVQTDGSYSYEENMRQTLLACYSEFKSILKDIGVTHVSVNGQLVKSVDLFSDELSLAELKGHRSIAVRVIDTKLAESKEGRIHDRKVALLIQEDNIELSFQKQAKDPIKPKVFTASLNVNFFDCAKCCGSQIVGCYAPSGEHCERPLEIGIRIDSGFLSIYDETGTEIENCEILLCEEGLYLFKAYTNGHPYNTSQAWIQIFTQLLQISPRGQPPQSLEEQPSEGNPPKEESPCSLVPAIIIPRNFPNQRTWDLLRRSVQPEMTGGILTCRHDFSPEWRTYYDHRPESIKCGVDIVLHAGFTLERGDRPPPAFTRQMSKINKDLAGLIFEQTMSNLLENEKLKDFRFLGKYISQYISKLIETGKKDDSIIDNNFDFMRWRTRTIREKRLQILGYVSWKSDVISLLVNFINKNVKKWIVNVDVSELWDQSHRIVLQLRVFLDKYHLVKENVSLKNKYDEIKSVIIQSTVIVPIDKLPRATQEELIHWIYHNEDRVWRYRGGRCGHETLEQFMKFIGSGNEVGVVYPGVATFVVSRGETNLLENFNVDNIIGYSVGEVVSSDRHDNSEGAESLSDCYEVVVGWVNPKYQKLNLSIHMYQSIFKQAPTRYVTCDVIQGSVDRIIQSNPIFRFLEFLRLTKYIVKKRQQSYTVQLQTGETEQFEQLVVLAWPIRMSLWMYSLFNKIWWKSHSPRPHLFI